MNRYLKSFGISFLLHTAALALGVWVAGSAAEEKDLLVVDFSSIAFAKNEEGGALPGAGQKNEALAPVAPGVPDAPDAPAPAAAPESPPPPEPEPPEPEISPPLPPEPEPPEPVAAQKAVPVPAKPTPRPTPTPRPAQTPVRQPESPDNGAVQSGSSVGTDGGDGAGGDAGADGGAEARGLGAGSGTGRDQGLPTGYIKANFNYILTRIQRNLDYPSQARRMHLSGIAKFSFLITPDGHIEDLTLMESSGHPLLDDAAFKAIQDAAPFPAPPVPARIIVPIQFSLRG